MRVSFFYYILSAVCDYPSVFFFIRLTLTRRLTQVVRVRPWVCFIHLFILHSVMVLIETKALCTVRQRVVKARL